MGAKLYADTATKTLIITAAPDVNGFVTINVQVDVWSDLIEDWDADVNLRKHTFPLIAIGGQTISAGKLGTTYVLADPWHMHPYEADHVLNIDGNLFTELALTQLVAPTVGNYTVTVNRNLSTLVEVVESNTSGLTPTESAALLQIATDLASVEGEVTLMSDGVFGAKRVTKSTDATAGVPGFIELWDRSLIYVGYKQIWEDGAKTIGYREKGIGYETEILTGTPTWP
jgi:hypothetical protein